MCYKVKDGSVIGVGHTGRSEHKCSVLVPLKNCIFQFAFPVFRCGLIHPTLSDHPLNMEAIVMKTTADFCNWSNYY